MPPDSFLRMGPDHVGALIAIGLWIVSFAGVPRILPGRSRDIFRWVFAGLCFSGLLAGVMIELNNPKRTLPEAIPYHLCSVSLFVTGMAVLRRSALGLEWMYVFGIAGVAQALLTPDLPTGFPSIKFLVFFFNHGAILAGLSYLMACEHLRPRPGAFLRIWTYGTLYMISAMILNGLAGTNFGYLAHKPANPSLLDSLGPWPYYILWMQGLGIIKIIILLLPFSNRAALLLGPPEFSKDFQPQNEQSANTRV